MPRSTWVTCLSTLFAALLIAPADAATQGPGFVQEIYVQNGVAIFSLSGPVSGGWPACAIYNRYAFNLTTAAGQAWYATILSAKLAAKPLTIAGSGSCSAWPDSEAVTYILVHP